MSTLKVTNIQATGETASRAVSGVAAAWVNFDGTGVVAIRDSVNVSSLSDNGAGDFTLNWSNNMSGANYSVTGTTMAFSITSTSTAVIGIKVSTLPSASSVSMTTNRTSATTTAEMAINLAVAHGDLA